MILLGVKMGTHPQAFYQSWKKRLMSWRKHSSIHFSLPQGCLISEGFLPRLFLSILPRVFPISVFLVSCSAGLAQWTDEVVPGSYLVRVAQDPASWIQRMHQKHPEVLCQRLITPLHQAQRPRHATPSRSLEDWVVVQVPSHWPQASVQRQLAMDEGVAFVEPNYIIELEQSVFPDDFYFERSWGLHNTGQWEGQEDADIDLPEAWSYGVGDPRIRVAVIDTGIDFHHPDLRENLWVHEGEIPTNGVDEDGNGLIDDVYGYDFVSEDGDPFDDQGHGTHVSGIIGAVANNRRGSVGVCQHVSLMAIKTFGTTGKADVATVMKGVQYAIDHEAHVINASWGVDVRSEVMRVAVEEVAAAGILFVAAGGNRKSDQLFYPAAFDHTIGVGATDEKDQRTRFSNFGSFIDLAAPGQNIFATFPDNRFGFLSGTSMAAPHVSGSAVLILERHPDWTVDEVQRVLLNAVDPLHTDKPMGAGRLNVLKAQQMEHPLPIAQCLIPERVAGLVTLTGDAHGERFKRYSLWIGKGMAPLDWEALVHEETPVIGGVLLEGFDTSQFEDGAYTLALEVVNESGQSSWWRQGVEIANVHLSYPQNNDVIRAGTSIEIMGSAFGKDRSFLLEYGMGTDPQEWFSAAMRLSEASAGSIHESLLGVWDTSLLIPNQIYSIRLQATDIKGELREDRVQGILLDGSLREGFPILQKVGREMPGEDWRPPVVADLDGDGLEEIVVVDAGDLFGKSSFLSVYGHDGKLWWRHDLGAAMPFSDLPLVGDLDQDGHMEILTEAGTGGLLKALDDRGKEIGGAWPLELGVKSFGKVMADLDLDGSLEIILLSHDSPEGSFATSRKLWVIRSDGSVWRSWYVGSCEHEVDTMELCPAVANLDEDPALEIVTVTGCQSIAIFDLEVPQRAVSTLRTWEGQLVASPVIGDLDQDGWNEMIVVSTGKDADSRGGVYVMGHQGDLWSGFPVLQEEHFDAAPALSDLDGDGDLEIIANSVSSRRIHAIHHHGFPVDGWPVGPIQDGHLKTTPVVADMNADQSPDILLATPGFTLIAIMTGSADHMPGVRAWNAQGQPLRFPGEPAKDRLWMESAGGGALKASPPVLTDLDGDGYLDVVATSILDIRFAYESPRTRVKQRNGIYAWSLPVPFDASAANWPRYQKDLGRSGRYAVTERYNRAPLLDPILSQTIPLGGTFLPIDLRRYASDPDHPRSALSWKVVGEGALLLSLSENDVLEVQLPHENWEGRETLSFTVSDPDGASAVVQAVFSVLAGYRPPVAYPDDVITQEDASVVVDALANDQHPTSQSFRLLKVSPPLHGENRMLEDGTIFYMPEADYHGEDSFEYVITDDNGGLAIGGVKVRVNPVNDVPIAEEDRVIVIEDESATFDPVINDKDPDMETIRLVEWTLPEHGQLKVLDGGDFQYKPVPDFHGSDQLSYVIEDPHGVRSEGRVQFLIKGINDPPVTRSQSLLMTRNRELNITFSAEDPDRDPLSYEVVDGPEHGTLMVFPQVATYRPDFGYAGEDSFTYRANDGKVDGPIERIHIRISDQNNPPDMDAIEWITAQNQPLDIPITVEDVDGDPVEWVVAEQPSQGTLSFLEDHLLYNPPADYLGHTEGKIRIFDDQGGQRWVTVGIEVTDQNTAPVSQDSAVEIFGHQEQTFTLEVVDLEHNPLSFEWVTLPEHGKLTGDPPIMTYLPNEDFYGFDRLQYIAHDTTLESDLATVVIEVQYPNHVPSSEDQSLLLKRDQPKAFALRVQDEDENPEAFRRVILEGPQHGTLSGWGRDLVYTPNSGFLGSDRFTWRIWDGYKYSPIAETSVRVGRYDPDFTLRLEMVPLTDQDPILIQAQGDPGRHYLLQSSEDLIHWEDLETQLATEAPMRWDVGMREMVSQRFFRVQAAP